MQRLGSGVGGDYNAEGEISLPIDERTAYELPSFFTNGGS
jgi:hypothetical protein